MNPSTAGLFNNTKNIKVTIKIKNCVKINEKVNPKITKIKIVYKKEKNSE